MGNRLFYIGMVLGLSTCFLALFAPCGLLFCGIHYLDKRKERKAAEDEAARQAHIERIIKLGENRISAAILVDEMREEAIDPLLPDQPPNTPNTSPLSSPIMRAIRALEEGQTPELPTLEMMATPEADTFEADMAEMDNLALLRAPIRSPSPIPQNRPPPPFFKDTDPPPPPPNNSPMFSPIRNLLAQGRSRQRQAAADLEAAASGLTPPDFGLFARERDESPPLRIIAGARERYMERLRRLHARQNEQRTGPLI